MPTIFYCKNRRRIPVKNAEYETGDFYNIQDHNTEMLW